MTRQRLDLHLDDQDIDIWECPFGEQDIGIVAVSHSFGLIHRVTMITYVVSWSSHVSVI